MEKVKNKIINVIYLISHLILRPIPLISPGKDVASVLIRLFDEYIKATLLYQ